MTKIQIYKKNDNIVGFTLSGHTGFSEEGQDVLCAGISAISQSTVLGILQVLNLKPEIKRNDNKGYLKLDLLNCSEQQIQSAQVLLKTMQKSLEDISIGNKKYMKVEVYDEF